MTIKNDIAMLQLQRPISDRARIIPLCSSKLIHGSPVRTCGMGSTNGRTFDFPDILHEAHFQTNDFESINPFILNGIKKCRSDSKPSKTFNLCFFILILGSIFSSNESFETCVLEKSFFFIFHILL